MKFRAAHIDGAPIEVDRALRIYYEIAGKRVAFAVHPSLTMTHTWSVSHWNSGRRVADVSIAFYMRTGGDPRLAAKLELESIIQRVGAENVLAKLKAAPALPKG